MGIWLPWSRGTPAWTPLVLALAPWTLLLTQSELRTLCTPTLPTSSLLSTYALISPLSHRPPAPFCALSLSRSASGPMTKTWPTSVKTSKVGKKDSSTSQLRNNSMYFVISFVTIMPPAAFTGNFLKCSRSIERILMAISVRKAVRFGDGERAARARLCRRRRNVKMLRQVYSEAWSEGRYWERKQSRYSLVFEAALARHCLRSMCHPSGENRSLVVGPRVWSPMWAQHRWSFA